MALMDVDGGTVVFVVVLAAVGERGTSPTRLFLSRAGEMSTHSPLVPVASDFENNAWRSSSRCFECAHVEVSEDEAREGRLRGAGSGAGAAPLSSAMMASSPSMSGVFRESQQDLVLVPKRSLDTRRI